MVLNGSGKTLSAVQYCIKCLDRYEMSVFCTNVEIREYPINCYYKIKVFKDNKALLQNAPEQEDNMFKIPKVI